MYCAIILFLLAIIVMQEFRMERCKDDVAILNKAVDKALEKSICYVERNANVSLNGVKELHFSVKGRLIYCFTDDMCDECIRQDLQELYKFQLVAGKENLMVFPICEKKLLKSAAWEGLLRTFNYDNISDTSNFPFDKESGVLKRYIAYIGDNGKIESIFFPAKYEQTLTQIYLQTMIHKFDSE